MTDEQPARLTASPVALVAQAIGGPRQIAGKLARLGRTLRLYVDGTEIERRLQTLQAKGYIERRPTRLQLLFGGLDMVRFVIEPASRDYYRQKGISFGFHQLLRLLDDPVSLLDPTGFLSDRDTIVATLSIFDEEHDVVGFAATVREVVEQRRGPARVVRPHVAWTVEPETVMRPRDAFFAWHETVPAQDAIGRVCAEIVAPYPPGVPVLAPGELITAGTLQALRDVQADGAMVRYAADPQLTTFQVVRESS